MTEFGGCCYTAWLRDSWLINKRGHFVSIIWQTLPKAMTILKSSIHMTTCFPEELFQYPFPQTSDIWVDFSYRNAKVICPFPPACLPSSKFCFLAHVFVLLFLSLGFLFFLVSNRAKSWVSLWRQQHVKWTVGGSIARNKVMGNLCKALSDAPVNPCVAF